MRKGKKYSGSVRYAEMPLNDYIKEKKDKLVALINRGWIDNSEDGYKMHPLADVVQFLFEKEYDKVNNMKY